MSETRVLPFLMFQENNAETAMNYYISLFQDGKIIDIKRYGPQGPGTAGSVMKATFSIAGQTIHCIDSPVKHAFTFTPSFSLWVDCVSEEQIGKLAASLKEGGAELMPLDNYGFSRKFTWLNDKFGVSWQLNLA